MGQDGRFEKWAGIILGLVSLVLGLHLAKTYVLPRLDSHPRISARQAVTVVPRPAPSKHSKTRSNLPKPQAEHFKARKESSGTVARRTSMSPRKVAAIQPSSESAKAEPKRKPSAGETTASSAPATDHTREVAKSVTAPLPATRKFETIGYVEKADGTQQAVVSKGDQVFVVHEGEVFDEHYRVLSISSSQVEAADLTVPQLAPAAAPEPTVLAKQSVSPAPTPTRKVEKPTPALAETKPLGFVERPGRPPEAIVPEGESVRLVASAAASDGSSAGGMTFAASRDEISSATGDALSAKSEVPPSLNSLVKVRGTSVTLTAATSDSNFGMPPIADALPSAGMGNATFRGVGMRSPPEEMNPSRAGPAEPSRHTLKAFCYVERPSIGREAFVALGDRVYSVREGTVIANRYRVLAIRPEGVQVEDTAVESRPPPWPDREVAENRKLPDESSDLGNHSPPAELPVSALARSVAFILTDFASSEVAPAAEPRQLAENPAKPTLEDLRPSILNVGVGPHAKTAAHNFTPDSGPQDDAVALRAAKNIRGGDPTDQEAGRMARNGEGGSAFGEIASLPLKADAELMSPANPAEVLNLPTNAPSGLAIDPLPSVVLNGAPLGKPAGMDALGGHAPALTTSSLPEISSISGSDLLLHFSIGNNGCYFP